MSPRDSSSKKSKGKTTGKFGRQSKPSPPEKTAESSPDSEVEQVDLQKTSAYPKKAAPGDILSLQRVLGNKSVAHVLQGNRTSKQSRKFGKTAGLQRHKVDNAPPLPEEAAEVQTKPQIQRHKVDNAPPLPEEEDEVQAKPDVQRTTDGQPAFGKWSAASPATNPFARRKRNQNVPAAAKISAISQEGIWRWKGAKPKGAAPVKGGPAAKIGAPKKAVTIGAKRISFDQVKFNVDEAVADGKSSVQASVKTTPDKRPVNWFISGKSYGSKINAKTGKITLGRDTGKKDTTYLMIMAQDQEYPKTFSTAFLTLYDAKFFEAKKDYKNFVASGPYTLSNFRPYSFGKFDVKYSPAGKQLLIDMKMKFTFPNNAPKKGETAKQKKARKQKEIDYGNYFIKRIHAGWSGKFSFKNIREPQSVWGKLNPIGVKVNLTQVKAGQHWEIKKYWNMKASTSFADSSGFAKMFEDKAPAFVKGARAGELNRLKRVIPRLIAFRNRQFKVRNRYKGNLVFLADYLKQINQPKFKLTIQGHASRRERKKDATLPMQRATAVKEVLTGAGLANHVLLAQAGGKNRQRVTIKHALNDPGYINIQDTTLHEFGHMLGLDDEYDARSDDRTRQKGWRVEHYDLVYAALGRRYGREVSKVFRGGTFRGGAMDSASVMEGGSDVRIQHYVTLWDALVQAVAKKAPVPKAKFGAADFKFNM